MAVTPAELVVFVAALAGAAGAGSGPPAATQWRPFELELNSTAAAPYANPYRDVDVRVTFTAPGGATREARGFWDGGVTWRVATFFPIAGTWRWRTRASSPGGAGPIEDGGLTSSGTVAVAPAPTTLHGRANPFSTHGALRVSSTKTHLEHADGTPFYWLGDTAWAGPMLSTAQEWDSYLRARKSQGFTVVQVGIAMWWCGPVNRNGDAAFTGRDSATNLTQLNPAFFREYADRIAAAGEAGLAVLIVGLMEPTFRYPSPRDRQKSRMPSSA
eukprot:NODE_15120_length_1067_cov_2.903191.p2 GENE.NODE_15120_length_1067_cov_2.903191~~NODE_15120_length_1067_cov_2.903191.p2  ORF type:complete len:272 (+),score=42.25 NODE_15120_length_1067_cov_2.903191:90-905(+)